MSQTYNTILSYNTILCEADNRGIATIIVNRPDKLNALNNEVLDELADAFKEVNASGEIRAVVLTGAGGKAFVAGADIGELSTLNKDKGRAASRKGQHVFQSVEDTRKPVVAAVNGYALGGGAELAMACHLRIASAGAVFGLPEVGLGIIPGYGGTQRLGRIIGRARALELILTGRQIKADEALRIGLINKIAERDPAEEAVSLLEDILKNAPLSIQNALKAVYHPDGSNGYETEAELFGYLCSTNDFKEGTAAFLEKRKPDFKGS